MALSPLHALIPHLALSVVLAVGCGSDQPLSEQPLSGVTQGERSTAEVQANAEGPSSVAETTEAEEPAPQDLAPEFFVRSTDSDDDQPEFVWLVDAAGNKTKLTGFKGSLPIVSPYDGELWVRSWEAVSTAPLINKRWRHRIQGDAVEPAMVDFYPELVDPSPDNRFGVGAQERGIRLYRAGEQEPVQIAHEGSSALWFPDDRGFTYYVQDSVGTGDLYWVSLDGGQPSQPQLLSRRVGPTLPLSPDGRWLLIKHIQPVVDGPDTEEFLLLDTHNDFASRVVESGPRNLELTVFMTRDGEQLVIERRQGAFASRTYDYSYEPITGGTRRALPAPPDGFLLHFHPTQPWIEVTGPRSVEVYELQDDGPIKHRFDGDTFASFGTTTERLIVGPDPTTAKGAKYLQRQGGAFETVWTAPGEGTSVPTTDLSHAIISQPEGVYSLQLELGAEPQLLDVPAGVEISPTYRGAERVIIEVEAPGSSFYMISWPNGEPEVIHLQFDEPGLELSALADIIR